MRVGLTPDELAANGFGGGAAYAGEAAGLRVLAGETVAVVGSDAAGVIEAVAAALPGATVVDGPAAARGGVLRIHAVQAARVGLRTLVVRGPVDDGAHALLAVADLAACRALGLTAVVQAADPQLAARFADRVAVTADGRVAATYPVLCQRPRSAEDVAGVAERVQRRLAGAVR